MREARHPAAAGGADPRCRRLLMPWPDRVDVDAGTQEMDGCRVANRVGADALADNQGTDLAASFA
jgi:hypothetical protein